MHSPCWKEFSHLPAQEIERVAAFPPDERLNQISQLGSLQAEVVGFRTEVSNTRYGDYGIRLFREALTKMPLTVLHNLNDQFDSGPKSKLGIVFINEPGVDASGLSREFVSLLFEGIKNTMKFKPCENGLYMPWLAKNAEMSPEDRLAYNELGRVMMFCLNADESYPIGMIFDQGVFVALQKLLQSSKLDTGDFNFEELFAIYAAMNSNNKPEKDMIQSMNRSLAPLNDDTSDNTLRDLFSAVEAEDDIEALDIGYDIDKIKEHFPVLQQALKRVLLAEMVQPRLSPLIEIAKGIKSAPFTSKMTWAAVSDKDLSPSIISERLQGTVTRDTILNKLEFVNVSPERQQWIKNWIRTAGDDKIKQFLFAMTGSSALGNKNLKISNRGANIYFHTCFNLLDIPLDRIDNEQTLRTILESTIDTVGGYSRA